MDVKVNVVKKFKVNGKEYNSIEEMPAAIREIYEKAVANSKGTQHGIVSSGKIVFNGQEYESVDSMPADVRQLYESVMKTVKEGKLSISGNIDFNFGKKTPDPGKGPALGSYNISKPIAPGSFLSPRVIALAVAVLGILIGMYFLMSK